MVAGRGTATGRMSEVRVEGYVAGLVCGLLMALCLAYSPSAQATPVTGDPVYRAWVKGSLMPSPRFRVFARNRRCEPMPEALGCARRRTVWVPLGRPISHWLFFHELGHVVHRQILAWWPGPAEQFADAYAWCSLHRLDALNPAYEYPGLWGWVPAGRVISECFRLAWWIVRFR